METQPKLPEMPWIWTLLSGLIVAFSHWALRRKDKLAARLATETEAEITRRTLGDRTLTIENLRSLDARQLRLELEVERANVTIERLRHETEEERLRCESEKCRLRQGLDEAHAVIADLRAQNTALRASLEKMRGIIGGFGGAADAAAGDIR